MLPRGAKSLTVDNVPIGTPIGRCWMRLFDYDRLTIAELQPGRGFARSRRCSRSAGGGMNAA
jgi:hypothetical protein